MYFSPGMRIQKVIFILLNVLASNRSFNHFDFFQMSKFYSIVSDVSVELFLHFNNFMIKNVVKKD